MFQMSEVQKLPAFNGRRSISPLRLPGAEFDYWKNRSRRETGMELRDGPVFDILTRGDWKTEWIYLQGMPGSVQSESRPPKSPRGGPLRVSSLPDFFVSSIRAVLS
jgi:hypothetical protein